MRENVKVKVRKRLALLLNKHELDRPILLNEKVNVLWKSQIHETSISRWQIKLQKQFRERLHATLRKAYDRSL